MPAVRPSKPSILAALYRIREEIKDGRVKTNQPRKSLERIEARIRDLEAQGIKPRQTSKLPRAHFNGDGPPP